MGKASFDLRVDDDELFVSKTSFDLRVRNRD